MPDLREFQERIAAIYGERDGSRGLYETFAWLVEEFGELSRALRRGDMQNRRHEFADVLAWLVSVASLSGVDIAAAADEIYGSGCPRCHETPCRCPPPTSPHRT